MLIGATTILKSSSTPAMLYNTSTLSSRSIRPSWISGDCEALDEIHIFFVVRGHVQYPLGSTKCKAVKASIWDGYANMTWDVILRQ